MLTFSNVVAVVALFIALGGVSYAMVSIPKNSVGSGQIQPKAVGSSELKNDSVGSAELQSGSVGLGKMKSDAVASPNVKNGSLKFEDFAPNQIPAGPKGVSGDEGATGPSGPKGVTGTPGTPGSDSTSILTGRADFPAGATTRYLPVTGIVSGTPTTTEDSVETLSPGRPVTMGNLRVQLNAAPGTIGYDRWFYLRVNGVNSGIDCEIFGAVNLCTDLDTVSVPAGSRISIAQTATGNPVATSAKFGLTVGQ